MKAAAEHVTYHLPNDHSRFCHFLDVIQNSDSGLQAAMAIVKIDNDTSNLQNDFELSAAHLLPYNTVQKKQRNNNKRGAAEILDVNGDDNQVSAFGTKPGIEKTGVYLHYHKLSDYEKLSKLQ